MGAAFPDVADALSRFTSGVIALCGENGPAIALIAAFLETLIGVGAVFPGGTAVVLAGFAAREEGPGAFLQIAGMAWLGMSLGSTLDYAIGRVAGRRLVPEGAPWRLARRWRRALRSAKRFMRRWGWWAIVLASIAGPGRSAIAVASGASGWSFGAFFVGQSIAAAVWSLIFAGVGYFAAGEAERLELVAGGAGLAIALVFLLLIGAQMTIGSLLKLVARRLRPRAASASAS